MKYLILILLFFAGCGDKNPVNNTVNELKDNSSNITFSQEYVSFSPISYEIASANGLKTRSVILNVTTLDTNYNQHFCYGFQIHYNLSNEYQVNLGNGEIININGVGTKGIHWFCNENYEVIITFIQ